MNTFPQVMVSSTFFDLKQVRADLGRFLVDHLGCTPLISEWASFPIDPDVNTIENCRRRVEREADILILIIGGRYGFVDSTSSRSVTNIEYLAARVKGIPIYAFVEKRVLAILPVWRSNKNADFSGVVDDPRVFGFIEEVRDIHRTWMREFEFADEIVIALRVQFAYLTLQGAKWVRQVTDSREQLILSDLRGVPLRIAIEKPPHWEYKLFAQVLVQELGARQVLREQKRLGITLGVHEAVTPESFHSWSGVRFEELSRINISLGKLINEELERAIGPDGQPGDVELLVFTARAIAGLYQETLEWTLRIRRVVVAEEGVDSLVRAMDRFGDDILDKIETFGPSLLRGLESIDEAERRGIPPSPIEVMLRPEIVGMDWFKDAVNRFSDRSGEGE
jgi:Domain of unknown function (DUF4062)